MTDSTFGKKEALAGFEAIEKAMDNPCRVSVILGPGDYEFINAPCSDHDQGAGGRRADCSKCRIVFVVSE